MTEPFPSRRRIYLLRHGAFLTIDPGTGEHFPDEAFMPLSLEGREQARITGEELAEVEFDRVICSQLRRTRDTAEIVKGDRKVAVTEVPGFREMTPGNVMGIKPDKLDDAFLGALGPNLTRRSRFLAGETHGEFADRIIASWTELCEDPDWSCALLALHGIVNRAILAHVLGFGLNGYGRVEQDLACINVIDVGKGEPVVRQVNYTPYNHTKAGQALTTMENLWSSVLNAREPWKG